MEETKELITKLKELGFQDAWVVWPVLYGNENFAL